MVGDSVLSGCPVLPCRRSVRPGPQQTLRSSRPLQRRPQQTRRRARRSERGHTGTTAVDTCAHISLAEPAGADCSPTSSCVCSERPGGRPAAEPCPAALQRAACCALFSFHCTRLSPPACHMLLLQHTVLPHTSVSAISGGAARQVHQQRKEGLNKFRGHKWVASRKQHSHPCPASPPASSTIRLVSVLLCVSLLSVSCGAQLGALSLCLNYITAGCVW